MNTRAPSPSPILTDVDGQAVIAIAHQFPNPPDYSEATIPELQDSWSQIVATLVDDGHRAVDAMILRFTVGQDEVGDEVADRAVELLWSIKDALLSRSEAFPT